MAYFYNYHVDPDIIMDIYMMGYYKAEQLGDVRLAEETHEHECHTNHPYLDSAYRQKYEEPEELAITNFFLTNGDIKIEVTEEGLGELLNRLQIEDIDWKNKENN